MVAARPYVHPLKSGLSRRIIDVSGMADTKKRNGTVTIDLDQGVDPIGVPSCQRFAGLGVGTEKKDEEPVMTTMQRTDRAQPWVEVTERSDGHFLPFLTGVLLFVVAAVVSIVITGLPH